MSTAWHVWTQAIASRLSEQIGKTVEPKDIVIPPDRTMGDFAFPCFRLAKERGMSPTEIAQEIAEAFNLTGLDVERAVAAGPYVNFVLENKAVVRHVVRDIEALKETYGSNTNGKQAEALVEYAQLNTHKEVHVGHVRNLALGAAIVRLMRACGWKIVPMGYHGDVGAHVAKCLWHFVKKNGFDVTTFSASDVDRLLAKIPKDQRTGKYLGDLYAESTRALAENPDRKTDVSFVQQKLEAHDPTWDKLWRGTRPWSLDELSECFLEMGAKIDHQYFESEVVDRGQEIVDQLLRQQIAKESQGAIVVDLENVKLGIFLIRKSDGTSLYATKDLALAELKAKDYPQYTRSLMVVDTRQSFYFKQLFETLRRLGFDRPQEFIGYEFVTLKEGAMSSREGNIVTYESFRDAAVDLAKREVIARHEKDGWSEGQVQDTAWKLAMGGIIFSMLKQDNDRLITFDMETALSFEGATGPYCQYAATRLGSILRKAKITPEKPTEEQQVTHGTEKQLALALAQFPERVTQAGMELRPSIIAQWCLECSQRINDFYRDVPVLESAGEVRKQRLALAEAARCVLMTGLCLLGIDVPEQM
ncbi:MAG: arginine--tRNA ligase [bacterium]|nr:arginine--tRNA ligase [bacterium]